MTITDILIGVGLILYIALGFRDGFFKKVFGILGFLGGLIAATKFFTMGGELVKEWLDFSAQTSFVISFFVIFLVISVSFNLFYRWFGRTGSDTEKTWSRFAGAIIGGAQGALAISLILFMFNIFDEPSTETKDNSYLYEPVLKVAPIVFDYTTTWIPESKDFLQTIEESFQLRHRSQ